MDFLAGNAIPWTLEVNSNINLSIGDWSLALPWVPGDKPPGNKPLY
jgi:hypothetical protein